MRRERGREEPLIEVILAIGLTVEGIYLATRASHRGHHAIARIALIVVGHPRVDISRLGRHLPIATQVIPRENTAKSLLALAVVEVGGLAVVGGEHW